MSALALSCLIFVLTVGGIVFGSLLRRALPEHHLSKDSQDVVRLGVGLIATIAALVLGLLIAAAKSSFDTQSNQIKQITADVILLDNLLAQYGPEARPIREEMRSCPTRKNNLRASAVPSRVAPRRLGLSITRQLADDVGPRWADVHLCGFCATCVAKPPRS
jgi:hypothetical protein